MKISTLITVFERCVRGVLLIFENGVCQFLWRTCQQPSRKQNGPIETQNWQKGFQCQFSRGCPVRGQRWKPINAATGHTSKSYTDHFCTVYESTIFNSAVPHKMRSSLYDIKFVHLKCRLGVNRSIVFSCRCSV